MFVGRQPVEQPRCLRAVAHTPRQGNRASVGAQQSSSDSHQGGLPAAIFPDQRHRLSRPHGEVHASQNHLASEALLDPQRDEGRLVGWWHSIGRGGTAARDGGKRSGAHVAGDFATSKSPTDHPGEASSQAAWRWDRGRAGAGMPGVPAPDSASAHQWRPGSGDIAPLVNGMRSERCPAPAAVSRERRTRVGLLQRRQSGAGT